MDTSFYHDCELSVIFPPNLCGVEIEKMKKVMILVSFSLSGCIGDDILSDRIEAQLRLLNPIDTLALGDSYQFELAYFNMTGVEENLQEMT